MKENIKIKYCTTCGHRRDLIPDDRFDDLVHLARSAWEYENTISESIEYLARNSNGSELVLALVFFGRIWEDNQNNDDEDE